MANDLISKETLYRELLKAREFRIKWTMDDCNVLSLNEIFRAIDNCPVHSGNQGENND